MADLFVDAAQTFAHRLAGVSFGLLALALALHLAKLVARSRAWHNIAQAAFPEERLRFRHSLGAYLSGTGMNAVLPARSGEVLKLRVIRHKAAGTRYQGLASTILTETVFDVATAVVVVLLGLVFGWKLFGSSTPAPIALASGHPLLAAGVALGVAAVGVFAWRKLRRVAAGAARGFVILKQPRHYLSAVASWQLAALGLRLASIFCFLAAFHVAASPQTALLVLGVQIASDLIPLTPNGAGTQQALLAVALGASAVGFGAGMQVATAGIEVVFGLAALAIMTGSLSWRRALAANEPAVAGSTP
jgi:uncharacterized membrane protein YbhN (UPF0104 family)